MIKFLWLSIDFLSNVYLNSLCVNPFSSLSNSSIIVSLFILNAGAKFLLDAWLIPSKLIFSIDQLTISFSGSYHYESTDYKSGDKFYTFFIDLFLTKTFGDN